MVANRSVNRGRDWTGTPLSVRAHINIEIYIDLKSDSYLPNLGLNRKIYSYKNVKMKVVERYFDFIFACNFKTLNGTSMAHQV